MKLSQAQIEFMNDNWEVVFATATVVENGGAGWPRAIVVRLFRAEEERVILCDAEMNVSAANVRENNKVFVLSYDKAGGRQLKISGTAEYVSDGLEFEEIKAFKAAENGTVVRAIIVITPDRIEQADW
ncbi:MAG: pyridoxamine 5'-phosphate oxidase family protein [Alphaproteobacteria bacterium]|nr:pyridoxamine 5'-phosphate oxidase family protein [Alphaproteobacteria bacterium]